MHILKRGRNTVHRMRTMLRGLERDAREGRLLDAVEPYTMVDATRLRHLNRLVRYLVAGRVTGDLVECGVCNGGSAAVLAEPIAGQPNRRLWLYDTFEGIPPAGPMDGPRAAVFKDPLIGRVSKVQEVLDKVGFSRERTIIRRGPFEKTFREPLPEQIALLHVDADWFDSVLMTLRTFYPLLTEGGAVVLDDFGDWEGARRAFYAFCRESGVEPLLERVGHTQAYWVKGQEFNTR